MVRGQLKIVCLGDSITYGFPHGPEYSWVSMLDDIIEGEVINKGVNGDTSSDMLGRFNRSVLRYNPTHLLIMGGINDVMCRESFDRITWNIKAMVEKARENNIKVILGLPTAVDYPEFERLLQRIRKWIRQYAEKNDIKIIDFAAAFYNNGQLRKECLLPDGGHPTVEGYKAMFTMIDIDVFN